MLGERRAEGADVGQVWGGVSPSWKTRGPGERCKLLQWSPGQSPGREWILVEFEVEKTHLTLKNLIICEPIHACNCYGLLLDVVCSVRGFVK